MIAIALVVGIYFGSQSSKSAAKSLDASHFNPSRGLAELIALPLAQLDGADIAVMNLMCAQDLPGSEELEITNSLRVIDSMASRVGSETKRHFYRFRNNPAEFENSEGFFRMLILMVVLTEDFQVHYTPNKIGNFVVANTADGFFSDSRDVFLHGLTARHPRGTCSSLPVLQVAVGRRLGYPVKLVTTKGHLFLRWEDSRERFNFEAAGQGANRFSDEYYKRWPFELTQAEVEQDGHLKALTSAEEFAIFLSIRGMCLKEARQSIEASLSFQEAARRFPSCQSFRILQQQMEQEAKISGGSAVVDTKQ